MKKGRNQKSRYKVVTIQIESRRGCPPTPRDVCVYISFPRGIYILMSGVKSKLVPEERRDHDDERMLNDY